MKKWFLILFLFVFYGDLTFPQYLQPVLEGTHQNAFTKVAAPSIYSERVALNKTATSDFQVFYTSNEPPVQAKNAIEEAVNIWGYLINTAVSQTIKVLVKWEDLGYNSTEPYPLAHCSATSYYNSPSLSQIAQYPIALAEYLLDEDLNGENNEMSISVNSNDSVNWYFGLDGVPQTGKVDMISVILHEIAHGLGFHKTFNVSGNLGYQGVSGFPQDTLPYPSIYDRFIVNSGYYPNVDLLLNYPNSSSDLRNKLISNNVFFNGDNAWIQNGENLLPKLYAPSNWNSGSSISHLDEDTYPTGSSNSLMTHRINQAEVVHSPGEVGLAILQDMGWTINRLATFTHPEPGVVLQKGAVDTILWKDNLGGSYSLDLLDSLNIFVATICTSGVAGQGFNEYVWTVPSNIPNGKYRIKETWGSAYGITSTFIITDQQQVAPPQLSYKSGTYYDPIVVTASCETPDAKIRYTINSFTDPDEGSPEFPSSLICSTLTTIRVKGFKNGMLQSNTTVETYNIGFPEPTVSLPSGDYPQGTYVQISWPYGYRCWLQKTYNTEPPTPKSQNGGVEIIPPGFIQLYDGINEFWYMKFQLSKDGEWGPVVYVIYHLRPALRIAQIDDEIPADNHFGYWNKWENNQWLPYPDTVLIRPSSLTSYVIKASQDFKPETYRKYIVWSTNLAENFYPNHAQVPVGPTTNNILGHFKNATTATVRLALEGSTLLTGGSVYFKDPWLIDSIDSQHGNSVMNRGLNALFKSRQSPFYADYNTNHSGDVYKGVFLNQNPNFLPNISNYSVQANQVQSINLGGSYGTRNFYFQNWSRDIISGQPSAEFQDSMALQTGFVFKYANAVVKANYKGNLLSNYTSGFSSNSQRKVVGTDDGKLHMVYESLGSVWYTISTDGGTTWNQEQKVNPLGTNAKGVSITHDNLHRVYIVYHIDRDVFPYIDSGIVLTKYELGSQLWAKTVYGGVIYSYDTKPVVSATNGALCVVYKPSSSLPLWLRIYDYDGNEITANIQVSYTDATCINASISAAAQNFCLAYQSGTTAIKYVEILGNGTTSAYQLVTRSGPFTYNINPSISTHGNNSVVSWSGYNSSIPTATVRRKSGGSWSSFSLFDNGGVAYPTNNNSHRSGTDGSIIAWYNMYNQPRYVKFSNGSFSSIMSISSSYVGRDIQVSDGSNFSNIKAIAYNGNTSLPYVVMPLAYDFNLMQKINGEGIFNYARLAVVSKDNSEIVYGIGDVKLDGKNIRFTPESDMIKITDAARLTSAMATESFSISSAGKLAFSECAYVIKRDKTPISTDNIKPVIEFVNSTTGKTIKVKEIAFEEKDTIDAKNFYLLDCKSLSSGEYYLRVKLDTKENHDYSLSDCIYEENKQLPKKQITEIVLADNSIPKEYSLEQNYPNPFNPTTTINYQIKEDGIVTLKLYDVLGEEIQTLVNEGKVKGRYGYTFDGSDLPSGVYVYQLKVNDFSSSKKLMLVK